MPTYMSMFAGAGVDPDVTGDEEILQTPGWYGPEGAHGSEGVASVARSVMGAGRGKGRGDSSSGRRSSDNWEERGSGVQHYQMNSGSEGSGDGWDGSSSSSWWDGPYHTENWSRGSRRSWSNYYSNWEWVDSPDPWADWYNSRPRHERARLHDGAPHGRFGEPGGDPPSEPGGSDGRDSDDHRQGQRGVRGKREIRAVSPTSPPAGRDVSGSLPSGEMEGAGSQKEPAAAWDRRGKTSSSYPPIFRAKPGESYKEWRRSVDFWLGGEGHSLPAELVGPRIMVQLRDRAGQLVHHLTNADVNKSNGMQVIMAEKSPIIRQLDRHKVDQHRKKLMSLKRYPHESMESYITRGSIYKTQLQALDKAMEMGEFFYTGLLVDGARLTKKDRVMIKTRAGSDGEEQVTNAMVELAPELEGEPGYPIGFSEPDAAARQGDEFLVQRSDASNLRTVRKEKNAVTADPAPWDDMETIIEEDEVPEEDMEGFPPELIQASHEAFALHFKAKQKIAEVKKLRQYFRRPESAEERKKLLAEKMRTSPCHRCGELGHWSRECPQKGHWTGAASWRTSAATKGSTTAADDWAALVALSHRGDADSAQSASCYKERYSVQVVTNGRQESKHVIHLHGSFWCQS